MTIPITMPALSPTMTEGTVAKWLVKVGDAIKAGDVIAEVETDKATMEVEAVDEGTLGQILVPDGTEGVAVNAVIALLLEEGEGAAALGGAVAAAPARPVAAMTASAPAPVPPRAAAAGVRDGARIIASPLARRMAAQSGLDLQAVAGSGPKGRIVKADIDGALAGGGARLPATPPGAATTRSPGPIQPGAAYIEIPTTNMRRVIARRLTEAKQQVPHFYLTVDCDIDKLLKLREELNSRGEKDGFKLSVNDFVIRASALALKKVPTANASWTEKAILQYTSVDISVAVALEAGLITPIIKHADQKGLVQIFNEMRDLAKRAKDGKLAPEEFQGGTFSVSNLGMYGIRQFDAVINPPQGAILAVGAGEQRPVVKQGALAIATIMTCTLSCDHRVVDGALGAKLLNAFKGFIEEPLTILL